MKLKVALLVSIISFGIHLYLTNHFHQVQMGTNIEKSSCNINSTFNCDSVAASDFASLFDIPVSSFGFALNLIIFGLLLTVFLRLTENPKKLTRMAYALAGLSLVTSVIMGVISLTQLTTYCLYCIALYVLSFILFGLIVAFAKANQYELSFSELNKDISAYIKAPIKPLLILLSIPVIALFAHKSIQSSQQEGDTQDFQQMVKNSISDWQSSKDVTFEGAQPSLIKGVQNQTPKIVIVEFADFRCGHCKRASGPLATFVSSHPDVQLHFYNFPLDGTCNDEIQQGNGVSCRLAKSVHCANEQKLGKLFHDKIFEVQKDFYSIANSDGVDNKLKALLKTESVDWSKLTTCMDANTTHQAIKAQAALGKKVGVKGTPKIYFNNKPLPGGFFLPILKEARRIALKQAK